MSAILMNLLPLLKNNWRITAVFLALCVVFGAGWKINGWRWESRVEAERAERQEAITRAVMERELQLRQIYTDQVREADRTARELAANLAEIKSVNSALVAEIESASLIKPEIITCPVTGEEIHEPANPFSSEFVHLWNDAGRVRDD